MKSDAATRRAIRHSGVWVELERCKDCRAHAYCTSHQEEKYDRYEKMVRAALHGKCPVEVNPGPRAAGVRLRQVKYNPILFQAQRPRSKDCDDCQVETLRYPRLGAFELWVCYGARREEAFSKLKCQRWPKREELLERMEELADSFGGWSSTDVEVGMPPPALPSSAPAPALSKLWSSNPAPAAVPSPKSLVGAAPAASSGTSRTSAPAPAAASSPKSSQRQRHAGVGVKKLVTHAELCELIKGKYNTVMATWRSFDRNSDGTVEREEFDRGLRTSGVHLPPEQLDELWQLADVDGSGTVCYQEFAQQLCGWNPGSSSSVPKGLDQNLKWSVSNEDLSKEKAENQPTTLTGLSCDPRIHKVALEDLTIDLFRARLLSKYGSLQAAFRLTDVNQDSEVSYEEWERLLPKVIGDVVPIDVCNLLWHQLDADRSGVVSFAEFFTKKLVDPHPEIALRQLECFGDGRPTSPTRGISRPTSPTGNASPKSSTSGVAAGVLHQGAPGALPRPKAAPGSSAPRPKRVSRPNSPSVASSPYPAATAEPDAPDALAKFVSTQKPPLPQDDTHEASLASQPAYDKKSSVSNFSTVASSADLRIELRDGVHRPLSAASSDVSMPSHLPDLGLSRPASEGLIAPALEAPAVVEDKDEYSECFEASMSQMPLAAPETPCAATATAPDDSSGPAHEASVAPLAVTAATLLLTEDCLESVEPAATTAASFVPAGDGQGSEGFAAHLTTTAATLLPAEDDRGEYSTEFEASASASVLARLQAGPLGSVGTDSPEAIALTAPRAPQKVEGAAAAQAAEPLPTSVGIAGPAVALPSTQDIQATLDRSEYSGFEASDIGLSAMVAEAPPASTAPTPPTAVVDSGAADREELRPTSTPNGQANRDTDDYSYGFEASAAGGGSLEIRADSMNPDDRPSVTVLDGEAEVDEKRSMAAKGIISGLGEESYSDFEGFEESMN